MNTISVDQNKSDMLMVQRCARYFFNAAEIFNYIDWALSVAVIILFNISVVKERTASVGLLITIIIDLFILGLCYLSDNCTKISASCRQYFDYKLFKFEEQNLYGKYTESEIMLIAAKIKNFNKKSYEAQVNNSGTDSVKGVKDWYIGIDESLSYENAVRECQAQNLKFDNMLINGVFVMFIITLTLGIIIFTGFNYNNTLAEIVTIIYPYSPLFIKLLPSISKLAKLHNYKIRCKEHFDGVHTSIKDRQALIDERRNLGFIVPNVLYKKRSPRIHKIIEDSKVSR